MAFRLIITRHSIREDITESDCSISSEGVRLIESRMPDIDKFSQNPEIILTSPYKRCIDTSLCISTFYDSSLTIQIEPLIKETMFNERQHRHLPDPLLDYVKFNRIYDTWDAIYERSKNFLDHIIKKYYEQNQNKTIFAVTHGGVINCLTKFVDPNYNFCEHNPGYVLLGLKFHIFLIRHF